MLRTELIATCQDTVNEIKELFLQEAKKALESIDDEKILQKSKIDEKIKTTEDYVLKISGIDDYISNEYARLPLYPFHFFIYFFFSGNSSQFLMSKIIFGEKFYYFFFFSEFQCSFYFSLNRTFWMIYAEGGFYSSLQ